MSKSSYSFANPFLFRKIVWEWDPETWEQLDPYPFRRILLLFRAILRKPERAFDIRYFSLLAGQEFDETESWEPPDHARREDCKKELAEFKDILEHAKAIVKTTGFPDADTWILALESGNPYAFVSILLSQLHNLRFLALDYSFVWQSGFPGLMLRHTLCSSSNLLSQFHFLTDVDYGANVRRDEVSYGHPEIYDEPGYPECNPEQFPAWFYLPALRSLKIWLRTKQGIKLPDRDPDLSRLERLILSRATIQEAQVPSILSLATSLKTLHLGMAYRWSKETALRNGSYIIKGLKSIKESLTNLSFGIEYFPPTQSDVWFQDGELKLSIPFYNLLTQFPNLRSVEVPVNLLAGWSTKPSSDLVSGLPENVEQLCLRADYATLAEWPWQVEQIIELVTYNVARLRSHMPRLRRVSVRKWVHYTTVAQTRQLADIARAACAQEGIHFEVVSDDISNGLWTETRMIPGRETY